MMESRPKNYPKLKDYKPSRFMLPTCHYDKAKADRAVRFIENLRHTKGKWAGKRFWLLPWQEQIIRDVFGIVDERGNRQFRTAYVEIGKKNGKSELAAAVALYLLFADNEPSAEVYGQIGDVFLGISTSGNSKNVLYAATVAKAKGMKIIGLTGAKKSKLSELADVCVAVPQTETYMIQELHLPVYHCWCLMLEHVFFDPRDI